MIKCQYLAFTVVLAASHAAADAAADAAEPAAVHAVDYTIVQNSQQWSDTSGIITQNSQTIRHLHLQPF